MHHFTLNYRLEEIEDAARRLLENSGGRKIWLLEGAMGAGKTTLIKTICRQLGTEGEMSSPTYAIANEYAIPGSGEKIYHLDLYRLRSAAEAFEAGIGEYLNSGHYCFVEWPGLILPLPAPPHSLRLEIEVLSDNERKVSIFIDS